MPNPRGSIPHRASRWPGGDGVAGRRGQGACREHHQCRLLPDQLPEPGQGRLGAARRLKSGLSQVFLYLTQRHRGLCRRSLHARRDRTDLPLRRTDELMPITYTVEQGDCLDSIAFAHDFFPDTIWNHPPNAAIRAERKDPNILYPGDVLTIPDKRINAHAAPTDARHKFRRKGIPKLFSVQVKRPSGSPFKNKPYEFIVDGGPPRKGATDGEGWLRQYIAPDAREAKLMVGGAVKFFDLGHLDPVSETSGVQGRLRILKFYDGNITGSLDEKTLEAIKAYELLHDLEVTGEVSEAIRKLLVEEVGS